MHTASRCDAVLRGRLDLNPEPLNPEPLNGYILYTKNSSTTMASRI